MNNFSHLTLDQINEKLSGSKYIQVSLRNKLEERRKELIKRENISNKEDFPSLLPINKVELNGDNPWKSKNTKILSYNKKDYEQHKLENKKKREQEKHEKNRIEEEIKEKKRKEAEKYDYGSDDEW